MLLPTFGGPLPVYTYMRRLLTVGAVVGTLTLLAVALNHPPEQVTEAIKATEHAIELQPQVIMAVVAIVVMVLMGGGALRAIKMLTERHNESLKEQRETHAVMLAQQRDAHKDAMNLVVKSFEAHSQSIMDALKRIEDDRRTAGR